MLQMNSFSKPPPNKRHSQLPENSNMKHDGSFRNSPPVDDYKDRIAFLTNLSDSITKSLPQKQRRPKNKIDIDYGIQKLNISCEKSPPKIGNQNKNLPNHNFDNNDDNNNNNNNTTAKPSNENSVSDELEETIKFHEEDVSSSEIILALEDYTDESSSKSMEGSLSHLINENNLLESPHHLSRTSSIASSSFKSTAPDISTYDSVSLASNESVDEDIAVEWARLKNVLTYIDAKYLKENLHRQIKTKNYSLILALAMLLPKNKFTGETNHCVRCHREYDPVHGDMSCMIPHRKRDLIELSEDECFTVFQCDRCCTLFKLEKGMVYSKTRTDVIKYGACFIGRHTPNQNEVSYEPEGAAIRCTDKGCVVYYV